MKLNAVPMRNGNIRARDSMSSHLRPLVSMKKYAIIEDLALSAFSGRQ